MWRYLAWRQSHEWLSRVHPLRNKFKQLLPTSIHSSSRVLGYLILPCLELHSRIGTETLRIMKIPHSSFRFIMVFIDLSLPLPTNALF